MMLTQVSSSQTLQEKHLQIRVALENRDYKIAFDELQNLRKNDAKAFALNNYDYLFARLAEKNNDLATAMVNYQTVVERNSVLREYALWHLAQIARRNNNLMLERVYLQQLTTFAPNSLLINAANSRISKSYFESGDFDSAIQSLQFKSRSAVKNVASNSVVQTPNLFGQSSRENLSMLGLAYLRSGKTNEARNIFTQLITNLPNAAMPDDFALASAKGLDELDGGKENFGKVAPNLQDFEHLRRALIYNFNRDFANAKLHYAAIVKNHPNSPNVPDAILQLGRIAGQQGDFNTAITNYERIQAQFPTHPASRDALNFSASAYSRLDKYDEAIARYQKYIEQYVENPAFSGEVDNPERPFLNIIDVLRDAGRDDEALQWISKTRNKFTEKLPAILAQFSEARIYLSQGNWKRAFDEFSELEKASDVGNLRVAGSTTKTEIAFLKAFCLEQLGRDAESVNSYLAIPEGRSEYYGSRASERLKAIAENPSKRDLVQSRVDLFRAAANQAAQNNDAERARTSAQTVLRLTNDGEIRREMLDIAKRAYAVLPAYNRVPNGNLLHVGRQKVLLEKPKTADLNLHRQIADELLFLGLYDEATSELESVDSAKWTVENKKPPVSNAVLSSPENDKKFTLAVFYKRGDLAYRAVAYAEPLWRSVPGDFLLELAPRESVELLYPVPFADFLLELAPPRNVDPRFALSIMRQESRYRADAKSSSAARGLMQFISSTADTIAKQLNLNDFVQDDLYQPRTAALFGSQYLSNLFKQFPNQPQSVAAAYNGGEINMSRWLARSRSVNANRYVSEIQFTQSKDYVFKVLANYDVYQTIYDERLKPKN
ncbi:MAG: transglycosylase SLT domain-containing protein [Pyrinomonadaceae bacterium]|nr:transglycosylase SLT domain-containing protein [Pyrinomonadaceae bacterium]